MADEPDNLVLEHLRAIRAELGENTLKIGALAESMVSMRRDINDLGKRVDNLDKRVDHLTGSIDALRADMRMIAIATDEHTRRLDRIDARLRLHDA